jgi:hypothetical protein
LQNGASLNGASYRNGVSHSNGVVVEAEFADSYLGNGKSALAEVRDAERLTPLPQNGATAAAAAAVAEELRNGDTVQDNGAVWGSRDPCEVGQLEACAQERYAGVASGSQAVGNRCAVRCRRVFMVVSSRLMACTLVGR